MISVCEYTCGVSYGKKIGCKGKQVWSHFDYHYLQLNSNMKAWEHIIQGHTQGKRKREKGGQCEESHHPQGP